MLKGVRADTMVAGRSLFPPPLAASGHGEWQSQLTYTGWQTPSTLGAKTTANRTRKSPGHPKGGGGGKPVWTPTDAAFSARSRCRLLTHTPCKHHRPHTHCSRLQRATALAVLRLCSLATELAAPPLVCLLLIPDIWPCSASMANNGQPTSQTPHGLSLRCTRVRTFSKPGSRPNTSRGLEGVGPLLLSQAAATAAAEAAGLAAAAAAAAAGESEASVLDLLVADPSMTMEEMTRFAGLGVESAAPTASMSALLSTEPVDEAVLAQTSKGLVWEPSSEEAAAERLGAARDAGSAQPSKSVQLAALPKDVPAVATQKAAAHVRQRHRHTVLGSHRSIPVATLGGGPPPIAPKSPRGAGPGRRVPADGRRTLSDRQRASLRTAPVRGCLEGV